MLYETFNSLKDAHGEDYFTSRLGDEIVRNLNPKFELREYQKEVLGQFIIGLTKGLFSRGGDNKTGKSILSS